MFLYFPPSLLLRRLAIAEELNQSPTKLSVRAERTMDA